MYLYYLAWYFVSVAMIPFGKGVHVSQTANTAVHISRLPDLNTLCDKG